MTPKQITKALSAGRTVTYTVRRLRGFLSGPASIAFKPSDGQAGDLINVTHRLKCFRFDEKPYDQPRWEQS